MSKKYSEKKPTGREFVDFSKELVSRTNHYCSRLPKRWDGIYLEPLMESAREIERDAVYANKVFINEKNGTTEEKIKAYEERVRYLCDAVREVANFDIKFEHLMEEVDVAGHERERLKQLLYEIIREESATNPEIAKLDIRIISHLTDMEFVTLTGSKTMKLKLTAKNIDTWMKAANDASNAINARIAKDRKLINALKKGTPGKQA